MIDPVLQSAQKRQFGSRICLMGIVVYALCVALVPSHLDSKGLLLLTALALYGEWRAVKLPGFGIVNPGEGFYLTAACLYGPLAGGLLAFLLGLIGDLRKGKESALVMFNFGWALTTFGLVGAAYPTLGWIGAGLVYVFVAASLQSFGERTFSSLPLSQTLQHQAREILLLAPAAFGFCYLAVTLLALDTLAILSLVMPLELVLTYVRTRELSRELAHTLKELELAQAELVATGRQAALGVMAAGIAHEINNPLTAAKTSLHMVKMMATSATVKPSLDLLEKSVDRCANIVGRMLKYSRKPAEGGQRCDLEEVLNDAILFCGRSFGSGGVALELDLPHLDHVRGDPTELVQIFSNLLANAHDAQPTIVRLSATQNQTHITLKVSDDGSGIPPALFHQIFEPFYTTKPVGSGTGLGLSIAHSLARSHGGDLKLKNSAPGRTDFELTLPLASQVSS